MKRARGCWGLIVLCTTFAAAGVGTWKNFTSMKDVRGIVRDGSTFWAATGGGLFSWAPGSEDYRLFTTAEGLENVDLTALGIDLNGDIWTGTSTGIIHVYSPRTGTLRVILDIANTSQTDKRINSLSMYGDSVLICTDFGLSIFRIGRFEFGDTFSKFGNLPPSTRIKVASAAIYQGKIWASITDGLANNLMAVASLSNPNLLPPESWSLQIVGTPGTVPGPLAVFTGHLFTGTTAGLYSFNGSSWTPIPGLADRSITALAASQSTLAVCTTQSEAFTVDPQLAVTQYGSALPYAPASITQDAGGQPVVGSLVGGLLVFSNSWISHFPNGPNSNQFSNVTVDPQGIVWCASGAVNGTGFYRYDGKQWISFTTANSPLPIDQVYLVSISCGGSLWASTYGKGVVEVPPGAVTFSPTHVYGRNVGMIGLPNDTSFIVVSNVVCDSRGNNWMTVVNPVDRNVLVVRKPNGTWMRFPAIIGGVKVSYLAEGITEKSLAVDAYDNVWALVRDIAYRGVISLANAGSIDSVASFLVSSADGLPSDDIRTIIADRDNNIWVGTSKGIGIILDLSNPKRAGGIAAYKPLSGLVINSITVDPLNQKWVGTSEGAMLLSPDGTQQLASYSVQNTQGKLMDNDIKSIAVDEKTGTVYFGTTSGLSSLTTAAAAPVTSFDKLKIYPNPYVLPNATQLTIDGLVLNSSIRILSIDGRMIRDLKTPGGRIGFWDGMDSRGNVVSTGVYVIVAYSEDGTTVANGKVAVIRR